MRDLLTKLTERQFETHQIITDLYAHWEVERADDKALCIGCSEIEYQILYSIAALMKPQFILEVGPGDGASSEVFALATEVIQTKIVQVGIDPRRGLRLVNQDHVDRIERHVTGSNPFFGQNDKKYDIVFIDGNHDYEAVLKDIEHGLAHMQPNGMLIAHDTRHPSIDYLLPVARAAATSCGKTFYDVDTGAFGLGVIY